MVHRGAIMLGILLGLRLFAGEYHVPRVTLPFMASPPALDGKVEADEWAGAARMIGFSDHQQTLLQPPDAEFLVGSDGKDLFIAVVSQTPPQGLLLNRVRPAPEGGNARVWVDDTIELLLDPLPGVGGDRERIYQGAFNAQGAIWDTAYLHEGGGANWRGNWRIGSAVHGEQWHFEIALPLADMGVTAEELHLPMGVRICRNWQRCLVARGGEWSPLGGAYKIAATMPRVSWSESAPVVQMTRLRSENGKEVDLEVQIRNPHAEPVSVKALLAIAPANSAPSREERQLIIAPGTVETVRLQRNYDVNERLETTIHVSSPDGATDYYFRDFPWVIKRPEPMFEIETEQSQQAGFNFSYYPSHNILRLKVDINAMPEKEKVTAIRVALHPAFGNPLRESMPKTTMPEVVDGISELWWELPELGQYVDIGNSNDYTIEVIFAGIKADPLRKVFSRHAFEWEGNSLGQADAVIPPFTPIELDGTTLRTVLREHSLSPLGLLDQVKSLDRELLQGPMRLEVTVGGQTTVLSDATFSAEGAPHRAETRSQWEGVLPGSAAGEWDYDGAMRWRLTLLPGDREIEHLRLVIPLKNELCTLLHVCTDGIRFNYAGSMPSGEGRIWESGRAARNSIIGDYVPYIWAGAEERGFSVFGENDAGWITSGEGPCQELVREGETLNFILNLIDAPTMLTEPRELVIGFMATPAKPMPENWRRWAGWGVWRAPEIDDWVLSQGFLGSTITWGAHGYCLETRPRDGDVRIWEKFGETRRTGRIDYAFIENWLAGYRVDTLDPEAREAAYAKWRVNINSGFRRMVGSRLDHPHNRNLFYFNARGVRLDSAEGQTFLDEWHREAVSERGSHGYASGPAYDLDPVESYRDYALWWYNQAFETRACDNIYWDDTFMQSNFDVVGTEAYLRPDGTIQPSSGLWNMRQLIRRTAILQHERGMQPVNVPHMTNTQIVPILSFAQMNYSWEDRNSGDYQDRFPRDYIRAESIGRQSGNFPLIMMLVSGTAEEQEWQARTGTGCILVHELRPTTVSPIYWEAFTRLWRFGYGKSEVAVSTYWDESHPLTVHGLDLATLALSKPGEALLVLTDYGGGGDGSVELDMLALQLPEKVEATDLESGESLIVQGNRLSISIPRHDFRLIHLAAAP